MYRTSVWVPTSGDVEHPSAGAAPPRVFNLWMKVVLDNIVPPEGPGCEPMDCSSRQGMEPVFGQVGSEPAGMLFECSTCAQTLLVSNELCHVALPKGRGVGRAVGVRTPFQRRFHFDLRGCLQVDGQLAQDALPHTVHST